MPELLKSYILAPIPHELREAIAAASLQIKKRAGSSALRWTPDGEICLTLVSLGDLPASRLAALQPGVTDACRAFSPLRLRLREALGLPTATMPKSIGIGVAGDVEAFLSLRTNLARQFGTEMGTHARPLPPHVEIARLRQLDDRVRADVSRAIKSARIGTLGDFTVSSVDLAHSVSSSDGPMLRSLVSIPLG
ncbi:MAG: hypothetical protein IH944_02410 [Armatimonadetes bacterium]|nr:hypothetical protein [Armatimonadota bacterium]